LEKEVSSIKIKLLKEMCGRGRKTGIQKGKFSGRSVRKEKGGHSHKGLVCGGDGEDPLGEGSGAGESVVSKRDK